MVLHHRVLCKLMGSFLTTHHPKNTREAAPYGPRTYVQRPLIVVWFGRTWISIQCSHLIVPLQNTARKIADWLFCGYTLYGYFHVLMIRTITASVYKAWLRSPLRRDRTSGKWKIGDWSVTTLGRHKRAYDRIQLVANRKYSVAESRPCSTKIKRTFSKISSRRTAT